MPDTKAPTAARAWWRPVLLAAGLAAAAWQLRDHVPSAAATWHALRATDPAWLLLAAALSMVSMAAFAEQQRQLLGAFGVTMRAPASLALTYARSAMAAALPAGSAISAGYAFRQFRARGAGPGIAAAVMLLSAVASLAGLAVLYAARLSPLALALGTVALILFATRAPRAMPATDDAAPRGVRATLRHTWALAATVPPRRWLVVLAVAVVNWLTDLACLLAAVHAAGLSVPVGSAVTGYLVAQLLRQVPATPGGIGIIEAALIVALTTAGAAAAPAAAAVLAYRVLSCWAVLPIGLVCWAALRTPLAHEPLPA